MFQKMKVNLILDAVITMIIGGVLLFWPGATTDIIVRAIGVLIILIGAVITLSFFAPDRNIVLRSGSIVGGVVVAVIGVWVLFNPHFFEALIPIIAGIIIAFGGFVNLLQALSLWKQNYKYWWVALVFSLLTALLGVLLFVRPIQVVSFVVQLIGGFLIFDGISDLWIDSRIIKLGHLAEKAAVQAQKDASAVESEGVFVEPSTPSYTASTTTGKLEIVEGEIVK